MYLNIKIQRKIVAIIKNKKVFGTYKGFNSISISNVTLRPNYLIRLQTVKWCHSVHNYSTSFK